MKKGKLYLLTILLVILNACYPDNPVNTPRFTLTISFYPEGSGTVVQDPPVDQGSGYEAGTQVTIQLFPNPDYIFLGWEGDVSNPVINPTLVEMDADKTVRALLLHRECDSCHSILELGHSLGDGVYTIDPDGTEGAVDPIEVYCDMTTDGGGWTLVSWDPVTYENDTYAGHTNIDFDHDTNQTGLPENYHPSVLNADTYYMGSANFNNLRSTARKHTGKNHWFPIVRIYFTAKRQDCQKKQPEDRQQIVD